VIANQFNGGVETAAVHLSADALAGIVTSSFTKSDLGGQDAHATVGRIFEASLRLMGMYSDDCPREWLSGIVQRAELNASYLWSERGRDTMDAM